MSTIETPIAGTPTSSLAEVRVVVERELRFWFYKERNGIFRQSTWKMNRFILIDKYSLKIWAKNESLAGNHQPASTFLFNRCKIDECPDLRSYAFRLTDCDSKEDVVLAANSTEEFLNFCLDLQACGVDVSQVSTIKRISAKTGVDYHSLSNNKISGRRVSADNFVERCEEAGGNESDENETGSTNYFTGILGRGNFKELGESTVAHLLAVKCPELKEIGKSIDVIDADCERLHEDMKTKVKDKMHKDATEGKSKQILNQIADLQSRIEKEADQRCGSVVENVAKLEEDIKKLEVKWYEHQKELLLPLTYLLFANKDGAFVTYEDFYCESLKGLITVDILPHHRYPSIKILIGANQAVSSDGDVGAKMRVKFYGLKLKMPTITSKSPKLTTAKITIQLKVSILIQFDVFKKKWDISESNLKIDMGEFKAPLLLGKGLMTAIIDNARPVLRETLVAALDPELGHFIAKLSAPIAFRGNFSILGTNLSEMKAANSRLMRTVCSLTSKQLEGFVVMQKYFLNRNAVLCTMSELCVYFNHLKRHGKYEESIELWDRACRTFCEKVLVCLPEQPPFAPFHFSNFIDGFDTLERKYLEFSFDLEDISAEISLSQIICLVHSLNSTSVLEEVKNARNAFSELKLRAIFDQINLTYSNQVEAYKGLRRNLDTTRFQFNLDLVTGAGACVNFSVRDLDALVNPALSIAKTYSKIGIATISSEFPLLQVERPLQDGDFMTEFENTKSYTSTSFATQNTELLKMCDSFLTLSKADTKALIKEEARRELRFYNAESAGDQIGYIYVQKPEVDLIIDPNLSTSSLSLQPGSSLFKFQMTSEPTKPVDIGLLPTGLEEYQHKVNRADRQNSLHSTSLQKFDISAASKEVELGLGSRDNSSNETAEKNTSRPPTSAGCHSVMSMPPHVKLHAKVPLLKARINLLTWMRSQMEFLSDTHSYSHYLKQAGYGEFTEDGLLAYQIYMNQFAKYLFKNVLGLEVNFKISLFHRDKEIFFKVSRGAVSKHVFDTSFLHTNFQFHYKDLLKDLQRASDLALHLL